MEQKNENDLLMLKTYNKFLIDLGLNISFSNENDIKIKKVKIKQNPKTIKEIDNYIKEWQIKNDHHFIFRNKNMFSKNILLLSEKNSFLKLDQPKEHQPELLDKMFSSIGQDIDDFFIINIDTEKLKESHVNKINEILKLYFITLEPKIFIDMCSDNLNKFFLADELNLNFKSFKIPSISNIIKDQSLKRDAWSQLKLLKVKLNEF